MSSKSALRPGRRAVCLALVLLASAGLVLPQTPMQVPPTSQAPSGTTRACSTNPVLTPSAKKPVKTKHPLPAEPPPVCLEVRGQAIEVQEFLQAAGRTRAWRMAESRASEDTWAYVRYFDATELDNYADTATLAGSVKFSSGKAAVTVRTAEIGEGFVRVQIVTHFQGEGKSTDKVMGQPGTQWPLGSTGLLERELTTALQTNYHALD